MGFSGDNTTVTCLSHKMKYKEVACGKRQGRNRRAREGAAGEKSPASLSPVGFRLPLI